MSAVHTGEKKPEQVRLDGVGVLSAPGGFLHAEEVLQLVGPAVLTRGMFGAAFFERLVELFQQLFLVLGEFDRGFHRDVAVQIAWVAAAHPLDALAAQPELVRLDRVAKCSLAYTLKKFFSLSVQLSSLGECLAPPFLSDSSNSFNSFFWCSVSLTGVSTVTWQYRSPG